MDPLVEHILAGAGVVGLASAVGYGTMRDKDSVAMERMRWRGEPRALIARSNHVYNAQETAAWLARLTHFRRPRAERYTKGRVWFTFRVEKDTRGEVWFWFIVPDDRVQGVRGTLPPTLEWHVVAQENRHEASSPENRKTRMRITAKHPMLPFARPGKSDPLVTLLRAMGPKTAVEIAFSPMDGGEAFERVRKAHAKVDPEAARAHSGAAGTREAFAEIGRQTIAELGAAFTGKPAPKPRQGRSQQSKPSMLPHQKARVQGILRRYEELDELFEVTIQFEGEDTGRAQSWFQGMLGALTDVAAENQLVVSRVLKPFVMSAEELAQLVHVPSPDEWAKMPVIRQHARTLGDEEFNTGVAIGYLRHPTQATRLVRIPYDQFTRHFLMTGMTGAGKSSTLVFMIQSIIDEWATQKPGAPKPGFTLVDPASETALIVLSRLQATLPKDSPLWKKVHFVSFSNRDYPVAMNLLRVLSADALVATISRAYGGGARIDEIVDKCVAAFQEDNEVVHVLAGMIPMLKDENWRLPVVRRLKTPLLRSYWEQTYPAQAKNPDYYAPVERRLRPFVSSSTALYFGQPEYALPIREWMDEGHILILDVKALGGELMGLLMGGLIERYYQVALTRLESTALTHFLLVDECHRVQTGVMAKIIAETRKFGLSLGMITQSVEQFDGELKKAIKDVLGNFISLRVGADSARVLAELTQGHFSPDYLRALDDNVAAVFTTVGGKSSSCETKTPPPDVYEGWHPNGKPVNFFDKPALRRRYDELRTFGYELQKELGRPAAEAEARLNFYLEHGYWPDEEKAKTGSLRRRRELSADDLY
ncbi:ATP-binding protein [Alicyclobacillus macrosporangiidus]|uniref:ATP-binding protein n=1 Tax=Alicyclobacillus macrosporangiidus TaxID=392015 RepID=UPI000497AAE3|nr:ATP-binding protein [Alicyclobacillus macrosporangiidus]